VLFLLRARVVRHSRRSRKRYENFSRLWTSKARGQMSCILCGSPCQTSTAYGPYRGGPSILDRLALSKVRYVRLDGDSSIVLVAEATPLSRVLGPFWSARISCRGASCRGGYQTLDLAIRAAGSGRRAGQESVS